MEIIQYCWTEAVKRHIIKSRGGQWPAKSCSIVFQWFLDLFLNVSTFLVISFPPHVHTPPLIPASPVSFWSCQGDRVWTLSTRSVFTIRSEECSKYTLCTKRWVTSRTTSDKGKLYSSLSCKSTHFALLPFFLLWEKCFSEDSVIARWCEAERRPRSSPSLLFPFLSVSFELTHATGVCSGGGRGAGFGKLTT